MSPLHGVTESEDRWVPADAAGLDNLDALAYRSNLLGSDR